MRDTLSDDGIPANELSDLAGRLRAWQPSVGGLDRDRLIFEAGKAAGLAEARATFRRRLWPLAMAASILVAVGLFVAGRRQPNEPPGQLAEAPISKPRQPQTVVESSPIIPIDPNSYLALARTIADGNLATNPKMPQPDSRPPAEPNSRPPLRARDFDRFLNL